MRFIAVFTFFFLASCVNNSLYHPADRSGYGFEDKQLAQDQFEVRFIARGDNEELIREYALYRAAQLTLEQDYFWFKLLQEDVEIVRADPFDSSQIVADSGFREIGGNCNPPQCMTSESEQSLFGSDLGLGHSRSKTTVKLIIKLLMGERPKSSSVFSAREISETYAEKLLKKY